MRRAALACVLAAAAAAAHAADGWTPSHADVRVICPMTVGGSFEARTAALTGSLAPSAAGSPALAGRLEVDLRTLDTGIDLRNHHMLEKYLEVGKGEGYDKAIVTGMAIASGDVSTFDGKTTFTARLAVHGTERPIAGDVEIRGAGSSRKISVTFPLMLPDYGIEKPRYLGVGVKDRIQVKAAFVADAASGAQ